MLFRSTSLRLRSVSSRGAVFGHGAGGLKHHAVAVSSIRGFATGGGSNPTGAGAGAATSKKNNQVREKSSLAAVSESVNADERFVGMTGAEIFHDLMREHQVDTIFGYPGGAILPVYDAIYESPHFDMVLTRHEQGAGHMAEGYARATGKPGIVLVTSGPGATNTVTPLMDALMDGTPLIVFTGQVPTAAMGSDAFQEADVVGITRACTKWNVLVKDVKELPRRINEAFEIATSGRPGPVLVDLPKDVTAVELKSVPDSTPNIAVRSRQKAAMFHGERVKTPDFGNIAKMVNEAKKPLIYAGQGIIQSKDGKGVEILKEFAEKANIPVTTTLQGMGGFDERSPLSLKMLGMHGSATANYAIQDADLILALGARFDDRVTGRLDTFAPEAKRAEREGRGGIVHFEISPKNLHKVVHPTVAVLGDVSENLSKVAPMVEYQERKDWFAQINEWKTKHPFKFVPAKGDEVIKPQQAVKELDKQLLEILERDGVKSYISTGVGSHQMYAAQYITWTHPRQCITSGGAGTMGYGLPAAIGAKVAQPDSLVINIDGDASFSMTALEMITAKAEGGLSAPEGGIRVKTFLLNNDFQGMVKQWQTLFYDSRYSATEMRNPDFGLLTEAMGGKYFLCTKAEDLPKVIKEFLEYNDGPSLMEVKVCKNEHVLPMVPAGGSLSDMILDIPDKN